MSSWHWTIGTPNSQFLHIWEIPYNLKLQINLLITTSTRRAAFKGKIANRLAKFIALAGDPGSISSTYIAHNCL